MNKMWIVLKTEFINTVSRRSFILTLILIPLVPALILGGLSLFGGDEGDSPSGSLFEPEQDDQISQGYVDQAGIITTIPEMIEEERLIAFESVESAREAVVSGRISGYYIIPANYIQGGSIRYVIEDFSPMAAIETTGIIDLVINYNLIGDDPGQFQTYQVPLQVEEFDLTPEEEDQRDQSSPLAFYVPYGVTMLFYIVIMTSASLMLNSVAKEKENRVMEILMSSIKPNQLLTGKILGLGLVGLLQLIVWMGSALILLRLGGTTLNIPPNLQLPPEILPWGILFFVLGYLLYATVMAGVGALVPNLKEASQATFVVILPILIPLMLVGAIIEQPHSTMAVVLSLIPFTAPNTIMTRMAVTSVPLWQLLTAIGLLIVTIIFLIRAVARMFRAQLLLTGKKFTFGLYLKTLLGQELEGTEISES